MRRLSCNISLLIIFQLLHFSNYLLFSCYLLFIIYLFIYLFIAYYLLVVSDYLLVIRSRYEVKRWSGYVMVHSTILIAYV